MREEYEPLRFTQITNLKSANNLNLKSSLVLIPTSTTSYMKLYLVLIIDKLMLQNHLTFLI